MTDRRHAAPDPAPPPETPAAGRRAVPRGAGELPGSAPHPRRGAATGVRASWWYSASGMAFLALLANAMVLIPVTQAGSVDSATAVLIGVLCLVSAVVQLYFVAGMRPGLGRGLGPGAGDRAAAGAMLVAGAAVLAVAPGLPWSSLPLISGASLLACRLTGTARWLALLPAAAALAVEYVARPAEVGQDPMSFFLQVFYPPMTIAGVWAWDVVVRLDDARAAEGRLAVARERLRFAADLHDIQGHSLQVIALKAELAERLLDASPDAARAQIAEIRGLAADSMRSTRELVQGYRAPALDAELGNAADVLAAAGFDCRVSAPALPDSPAIGDVFGRVLREATTNVLRHAADGPVDVVIAERDGQWVLRVENAADPGGGTSASGGSGLAGLRERLAAAGGALTVLSDGGPGSPGGSAGRFAVEATMPADPVGNDLDRKDDR